MELVKGIVVARSRKNKGYCLVLFDLEEKRFYRIVSDSPDRIDGEISKEELVMSDGREVELLDVVYVPVASKTPIADDYQSENILFGNKEIHFLRHVKKRELIDYFDDLNAEPRIFANNYAVMSSEEAAECDRSFLFLRVFNLSFYPGENSKGEPACKCKFKYNGFEYKDFSVTISENKESDLMKYCSKEKKYSVAYVCFSFGHPYEGKCYKFLCSFLGYDYYY